MEVTQWLERVRDYAKSERPLDNILLAVNDTRSKMQNRIFNSEQGTKDSQDKPITKAYSNPYKKVRKAKGLQTNKVDLEFTGGLRREVKTVRDGNRVYIAIPSQKETQKSVYLEQQYDTKIFEPTKEELKHATTVAMKLIKEDLYELSNSDT